MKVPKYVQVDLVFVGLTTVEADYAEVFFGEHKLGDVLDFAIDIPATLIQRFTFEVEGACDGQE
jgi:hypothetical protein